MGLYEALDTPIGSVVVSAICGLGIAALFRKVCKDRSCIVVHGPPMEDTSRFYYKYDKDCYKYTPEMAECDEDAVKK